MIMMIHDNTDSDVSKPKSPDRYAAKESEPNRTCNVHQILNGAKGDKKEVARRANEKQT